MNTQTHNIHILETILKNGEKTATDFHYISNANQYFCDLVKMNILFSFWGRKGNARVKFRDIANRAKALAYIAAMKSKKPA